MSTVTRRFEAPASAIWDVLADGHLYADWVVGARRIRHVDVTWPRIDARIHHEVGVAPFVLQDMTRVLDVQPGRRIELEAHLSHLGDARIEIVLTPDGDATEVEIVEHPLHGPGRFVPSVLTDPLLHARNVEALRRLERLVQRRAAGAS